MALSANDEIIIIVVVVILFCLVLLVGACFILSSRPQCCKRKKIVVVPDVKSKRDARYDDEITVRSGSVAKFASEVMHSNKTDSVRYVLSNPAGRDAFAKFLRTEYCEENFLFFQVR